MCKLKRARYELTKEIEDKIIEFIKRDPKGYTLCGEIAIHVFNNLSWTCWALEELVHRNMIKSLSSAELQKVGLDSTASAFTFCRHC